MAQAISQPVPLEDPAHWIDAADYPAEALRALAQGVVGLRLSVDGAGSVVGCTITVSSGSAALDAQACRIFSARARFRPADSPSGVRFYPTRVRWVLPIQPMTRADPLTGVTGSGLAPLALSPSTAVADGGAELYVGSDGIISQCEPIGRTYKNVPGPPDICRSYPVGSRYGPPTTRHGRPAKRRVRIRVSVESTPLAD